jgi:hypothetical protein
MQIEDFKRWHWVLISLAIGALLAYARTMLSPDEVGTGRGISPNEFAQNVARPKTGNGYDWVKQITIYPTQTIVDPSSEQTRQVNFVVCNLLTPLPNGKYQYKPVHFTAEIPFKVGNTKPMSDTYSVRDYLAEVKDRFPDVQYRYAWWTQPRAQFGIWMGGAVLLIGGLWPSLVSLLIGAGLGRPHKEKTDEYDLERFSKSKPSKAPEPVAKAGMSAAEAQKLRDMQDQMEKDLAAAGMQMTSGGEPASAGGPASSAPVKALTGTAVEPVEAPKADDEPKEYKGEFYPVAKPHHHEEAEKKS